jgi:hypothetical protein
VPKSWPKSLHTVILSDNEMKDLTEISCLSSLTNMKVLSIEGNPCLFAIDEQRGCHQDFDYRPYVLNWCLTVQTLDGATVTRKER